jgi:hypothetical protein
MHSVKMHRKQCKDTIMKTLIKHLNMMLISAFYLYSLTAYTSNPLVETLERIERNDPTFTTARFFNFGEPMDAAVKRLFIGVRNNTHLTNLEISFEAGLGGADERGLRLSNRCLNAYKDSNTKIVKKAVIKDATVGVIADALSINQSLIEFTFKNALFGQRYMLDLAEAIHSHNNIRILSLGIDLRGNFASRIVDNPHLQNLTLKENVDLTISEEEFMSFIRKAAEHPNLQRLVIEDCGEVSMFLPPRSGIIAHYHAPMLDLFRSVGRAVTPLNYLKIDDRVITPRH